MITAAYATKSTERGKCMNLVTDHEFIVSKWPKNTGYRGKKFSNHRIIGKLSGHY